MAVVDNKQKLDKEDREKWGLLLIALAFILVAIAVMIDQGSKESSSLSPSSKSTESGKRKMLNGLDRELKDSALREEMLRQQTEADNLNAQEVQRADVDVHENTNPLSLDQEDHAQQVTEEIDRKRRGRTTNSLDERINSKVARDQWQKQYEQQQKEEYIRQFLDNAQKEGVNLQLNENLDVTGLHFQPVEKPIRVPQSMPASSK